MRNPVARLVVKVVAWLPATFAVWYFAAPVLLWPVKLLVEGVAHAGLADIVRDVAQTGWEIGFATTMKPGEAAGSGQIVIDVNGLLYSFGMPLFAALVLAAGEPRPIRRLVIGYAVIVPFVAWGVLGDFLKNLVFSAGPSVAAQAGFSAWQRETIAFAYQFGSLILPTVVPAVTWVLMHRGFLERLRR